MLVDYATWQGELSQSVGDTDAHAHWKVAAAKGNADAIRKLHGPILPDAVRYLWDYFIELVAGLGSSGMGGVQATWRDVQAWSEMTGKTLAPWESRAVLSASHAYFRASTPRESTK